MQYDPPKAPGAIRDAATVVMLRDGAAGLEVFLLKRHGLSDVLGGVYVFPGGKVDLADADVDVDAHLDLPASAMHASLNEPALSESAAAMLHVAALREAFEETAVLYAQGATQSDAAQAWELLREGRSFEEVLAMMRLRLAASALHPWSQWITPEIPGMPRKRFDTRFFLAPVPEGQSPRHDNHEAVDSIWLTPRDALMRYREGEIELAPPQIMSLAHLSRHSSVASAIAEARARTPARIEPAVYENEEAGRLMCYPGDERHPVRERALPGPTRLRFRNRRFEPDEGFDALFAGPA